MARRRRVAPSVREIADPFHYESASMARRLLMGLEERGFIRHLPAKDRAIEVVRPLSRFAAYRFDPESKALHRVAGPKTDGPRPIGGRNRAACRRSKLQQMQRDFANRSEEKAAIS